MRLSSLVIGLLVWPLAALGQAPQPKMDYGHSERLPGKEAVGEAPDQIRVSQAFGRAVFARDAGKELGTVETVLIDRQRNAISVVVLKPAITVKVGGPVVLAWNSLQFQGKPSPRFVTELTPDDIVNAPSLAEEAGRNPLLVDVKRSLLGKKVAEQQGAELGSASDLVATFGDGRLVALGIEMGPAVTSKEIRAVPWRIVRLPEDARRSITIAARRDEVAAAPVMMTKAPDPLEGAPQSAPAPSPPDSTLENRTIAPAPAPSTRRK